MLSQQCPQQRQLCPQTLESQDSPAGLMQSWLHCLHCRLHRRRQDLTFDSQYHHKRLTAWTFALCMHIVVVNINSEEESHEKSFGWNHCRFAWQWPAGLWLSSRAGKFCRRRMAGPNSAAVSNAFLRALAVFWSEPARSSSQATGTRWAPMSAAACETAVCFPAPAAPWIKTTARTFAVLPVCSTHLFLS